MLCVYIVILTCGVEVTVWYVPSGKGRGRQVIAVARTADLVLMMLDAAKGDIQRCVYVYVCVCVCVCICMCVFMCVHVMLLCICEKEKICHICFHC